MIVFKGLEYSFFVRYLRISIEIFVLKFKLWITTKKYILYKCGWLRLCLDSSVIFVGRKSLKAIEMTNTKIRKIGRPITKVLCQDFRLFHRSFHDNSITQWGQNCYEVAFVKILFGNNLMIHIYIYIYIYIYQHKYASHNSWNHCFLKIEFCSHHCLIQWSLAFIEENKITHQRHV